MRTDVYSVLAENVIVAADSVLGMIAAWDGERTITYYESYGNNVLSLVDTYEDGVDLILAEARDLSFIYFTNVINERQAA